MAGKKCGSVKLSIGLLITSAIVFFLSVLVLALFPKIFESQLDKQIQLVNGTYEFKLWQSLPIDIYAKFYYFNVTNPKEFIEGRHTLNVSEVGPYVYKSHWTKENIRWYPNKTVTYQERRTFHFERELSVGPETDRIYTLNAPMIMAADFVKDKNVMEKFGLGFFFAAMGEELVINRTIADLTFTGYEDEVIKKATWFKKDIPFKDGIFCWMYGKNDTYDGQFNVFTGESDISKLNVITNFNGEKQLNFWSNDSCNNINVPSGELGPPLKDGQTEYGFFQSLLCRTLYLPYSHDGLLEGLTYRRFEVDESVFANSSINEKNHCFQTKPQMLTGVQDVGPCQFDAPVYMSFPHFYLADPAYLNPINGLQPDKSKHSSFLDVEPQTGASLGIQIRFQINVQLEPIVNLAQFEHVPEGLFPVLWVEINAQATDDVITYIRTSLRTPKIIVYTSTGLLILVSIVMFIVGIIMMIRSREEDAEVQPIYTDKVVNRAYSSTDDDLITNIGVVSSKEISREEPKMNKNEGYSKGNLA